MLRVVEFEVSGTEDILRVSSLRPLMRWHALARIPFECLFRTDIYYLIILFCIFVHIRIRRAWDEMRFRLALKIRLSVILARYI